MVWIKELDLEVFLTDLFMRLVASISLEKEIKRQTLVNLVIL